MTKYSEMQRRVLIRLQERRDEFSVEAFWFYRDLIEDGYVRKYKWSRERGRYN